jgi:hypothetical protein
MVEQNLKQLKQLFEAGVISTIEGQTSGRAKEFDDRSERADPSFATRVPDLAHEAKGGIR